MQNTKFEGYFDFLDNNLACGWVYDSDNPDLILNVDIFLGDKLITSIPANLYRHDLELAGKGDGFHAYEFLFPTDLKDGSEHFISVKVSNTEYELMNSPKVIRLIEPKFIIMDNDSDLSQVENTRPKTPSLGNLFTYNPGRVLITCCNTRGGLYSIDFSDNNFELTKIMDGDFRGIKKYDDYYIIATNSHGILKLNSNFKLIKTIMPWNPMDYHGVEIYENKAYIVETRRNAIGIYKLPELDKIGEIRLSSKEIDIYHINDLWIENKIMYLSMFSKYGEWRKSSPYSGSIASLSLENHKLSNFIYKNLIHPHSITINDNNFFYCVSSKFEVRKNNEVIFKGTGYTRGLAFDNKLIYIGQSASRNTEISRSESLNISLDCGVIVLNEKEKISRFIPIPSSEEVYNILVDNVL